MHEVWCANGGHMVPVAQATAIGERVGPDLLTRTDYICDDCAEELERMEDKLEYQ